MNTIRLLLHRCTGIGMNTVRVFLHDLLRLTTNATRRDFLKGAVLLATAGVANADDTPPPAPLPARVVVTADGATRAYDRLIFGGFLEHFDNQIYGGVFDPGSHLADAQGFRSDVIEALRELKTPIIRWPGGCFVDSYHWRNGVGAERTPHGDFRWGVIEPNTFGTHEFVALCRKIGAEPYICLNGLADPRENLDWVAYCNATEGPMADLRKANGHAAPLDVKYWSVGNERYDRPYIHRVRDTARAMKAAYPGILVSCSGAQDGTAIHPYLLEQAGACLDFVSIHSYALPRANDLPRFDYLTAVGKSDEAGKFMTRVSAALADAGVAGRIRIAYDEWNLRAWQHPGFPRDAVGNYDDPAVRELVDRRRQNDTASDYTMADALFTASFLNACLRHAEHVTMANIAPLVNTRGPLFVHPEGIVKRTHFHVMAMYARLLQERVEESHITAAALTDDPHSVGVIDAIATIDASGKRHAFALINRHPQSPVACTLHIGNLMLDGLHPATILHADSADAFNDIAHPERVAPRQAELRFQNNTTTLPPHSLTIVRLAGPQPNDRGDR
jgi:alpha-N-arabinofuranosidase